MSRLRVDEIESIDTGAVVSVARSVVAVDSIADLLALPVGQRKEGLRYLVKGYHSGSGIGGGEFYYDNARASENDLGTILYGFVRVVDGDINPYMFGAKGDGVTDDSDSFVKTINHATKNKRDIKISSGTFVIKRTLVIGGSINVYGEGRGTILDFSSMTDISEAPYNCAIIFPHPLNTPQNTTRANSFVCPSDFYSKSGSYGALKDVDIKGMGKSNSTELQGIFINTPTNLENVRVREFSSHGIIISANVSTSGYSSIYEYTGIANWSRVISCNVFNVGGNGIYMLGSDANTFTIASNLVAVVGGYGVFDHSLLGGTVNSCEVDHTGKAAYAAAGGSGTGVPSTPSNTQWISNYAEGGASPVHYATTSRQIVTAPQGGSRGAVNILQSAVDTGIYTNGSINVASSEANAQTLGEVGTETASRLTDSSLHIRCAAGRDPFVIAKSGTSYVSVGLGSFLIPLGYITDSVGKGIPWFTKGLLLDTTSLLFARSSVPSDSSEYHRRGEVCFNSKPARGQPLLWVCVGQGYPGTWVPVAEVGTTNTIGATSNRPSAPMTGHQFYDTGLKKPIWWDGSAWVDAVGVAV